MDLSQPFVPQESPRPRRRRRSRVSRVLFKVLIAALIFSLVFAYRWGAFSQSMPPWEGGLDVTYVHGPRRSDGSIDYAAVLNAEWAEGVAADTNAARWYLDVGNQAESNVAPEMLGAYAEMLSWNQDRFPHKISEPDSEEYTWASQRLWDGDFESVDFAVDLDAVRSSLANNKQALTHLLEGTQQKSCYIPILMMPPNELLLAGFLPLNSQMSKQHAKLLYLQSVLHLVDGEFESASAMALAMHRLARHIASTRFAVCWSIASETETQAFHLDQLLLADRRTPAAQSVQHMAALDALPPFPSVGPMLLHSSRISLLDAFSQLARGDSLGGEDLGFGQSLMFYKLNWQRVLRHVNDEFLLIANVLEETCPVERWERLRMQQSGSSVRFSQLGEAGSSRDGRSDKVAAIFLEQMMPGASQLLELELKLDAQRKMTRIAFALGQHYRQTEQYPATLAELADSFGEPLPQNPCTKREFYYQSLEDSFDLFGEAPDRQDEEVYSYGVLPPK